jgi:ubiquitin carboxyl-terminal hydrolase 25/28
LLFLQLYKSEESAVRPDEELAYLAITRPEVDHIVGPEVGPAPTRAMMPSLDSIPDAPSPCSTRVASPDLTPTERSLSPPPAPMTRSRSVLGKRASQDRERSAESITDRSRIKSEGFEDVLEVESPMEGLDDFEMIDDTKKVCERATRSPTEEIAALRLKSPVSEEIGMVPPPLPPRPVRQATLASGLQFGAFASSLS